MAWKSLNEDVGSNIDPDYSQTPFDVYCDIVKSIIRERQVLEVFNHVGHTEELTGQKPSWMPHWSPTTNSFSKEYWSVLDVHRVDNDQPLVFRTEPDSDLLIVEGIIFDKISWLGELMTLIYDFSDQAAPKQAWDKVREKVGDTSAANVSGVPNGLAFTLTAIASTKHFWKQARTESQRYQDAAAYWNLVGALDLELECQKKVVELTPNKASSVKNKGDPSLIFYALKAVCIHWRLILTANGYIGVAPAAARVEIPSLCYLVGVQRTHCVLRGKDIGSLEHATFTVSWKDKWLNSGEEMGRQLALLA